MRNVAALTTGVTVAQAITMAFAPIITRLYGPEAFGILGVFMSIVAIVTPVAALTYPIAIVLSKSDQEAKGLIRISAYTAVLTATTITIILMLFTKPLVQLLQIEVIAPYLLFIPLVMLFAVAVQIAQQWLIRKKQFKVTAKVTVAQSLIVNSTKAGVGLFHPVAAVLVTISVFGSLLNALMLALGVKQATSSTQESELSDSTEPASMQQLAKRHKDFPMYRAPQVFINAMSESLPIFMLTAFFGPATAGFYAIGKAVLGLPTTLIAKSVFDVFYQRFNEAAQDRENLKSLLIKTTLGMGVIGFLPYAIVIAFGPHLFSFIFGAEWMTAGEYARWLALWLFFRFINRPCVAAVPVLGLQKGLFIYELFSTCTKLMALAIGLYLFKSDILAIGFFSVMGVIAYIVLILWIVIASKGFNEEAMSGKTSRQIAL